MSFWKIGILVLICIVLVAGIYNLRKDNATLRAELKKISATVSSLESENESLTANITYLERPENLLKELKSQFNYTEAGEKLIILVSSATTTPTSTAR